MVSAICASVGSYRSTEADIISDMNRALVITLHDRQDQWLTPDTIEDYRSHLRIGLLKQTSTLCYVLDDRHGLRRLAPHRRDRQQLTSNAMPLSSHAIQGYANCSFADVFGMSDQRTPFSLTLMAMIWAVAATAYHRRRNGLNGGMSGDKKSYDNGVGPAACLAIAQSVENITTSVETITTTSLGTLSYSANDDCFYNSMTHQPVRFTPMQHQLMQMFFTSSAHQLSKAAICSALWPKKPDASDTLYTLIRRVKPLIEAYGLSIEADRGRAYRLTGRGNVGGGALAESDIAIIQR